MIRELPYCCKFCGKPGVSKYDDDCPGMKLEVWKSMLSCNRCADFERSWFKGVERIEKWAFELAPEANATEERKQAIKRSVANGLVKLTDLVCDYLRTSRAHYNDLYEEIVKHPRSAARLLGIHRQRSFDHVRGSQETMVI